MDVIHDLAGHLATIRRSQNTIDNYTRNLRALDSFLRSQCKLPHGLNQLRLVTAHMLDAFYAHLSDRDLSPSTLNVYVNAIRCLYRRQMKLGNIQVDCSTVLQCIAVPVDVRNPSKMPFSDDELALILACCEKKQNPKRDYALILFLIATGLRASEVGRLNVSDMPEIRNGGVTVKVKGGRYELKAVGEFAIPALDVYLKTRENLAEDQPLFITKYGARMNRGAVYDVASAVQKAAETGRTGPHLFRHSLVSRVMSNDGYLMGRDVAGHNPKRTTDRYGHTALDQRRKAIDGAFAQYKSG